MDEVETVVPTASNLIPQNVGSEWEQEVHDTAYQYMGTAVQVMRTVSLLQRRAQSQRNKAPGKPSNIKLPPIAIKETPKQTETSRETPDSRKRQKPFKETPRELSKRSISLKEFLSERTSTVSPKFTRTPDGLITNLKLPGPPATLQRQRRLPPLRPHDSGTISPRLNSRLSPDAKKTLNDLKEDLLKESRQLRGTRSQIPATLDPEWVGQSVAMERWNMVRKFVRKGALRPTKRVEIPKMNLWKVSHGNI